MTFKEENDKIWKWLRDELDSLPSKAEIEKRLADEEFTPEEVKAASNELDSLLSEYEQKLLRKEPEPKRPVAFYFGQTGLLN